MPSKKCSFEELDIILNDFIVDTFLADNSHSNNQLSPCLFLLAQTNPKL